MESRCALRMEVVICVVHEGSYKLRAESINRQRNGYVWQNLAVGNKSERCLCRWKDRKVLYAQPTATWLELENQPRSTGLQLWGEKWNNEIIPVNFQTFINGGSSIDKDARQIHLDPEWRRGRCYLLQHSCLALGSWPPISWLNLEAITHATEEAVNQYE